CQRRDVPPLRSLRTSQGADKGAPRHLTELVRRGDVGRGSALMPSPGRSGLLKRRKRWPRPGLPAVAVSIGGIVMNGQKWCRRRLRDGAALAALIVMSWSGEARGNFLCLRIGPRAEA